jgi:hypothetical protein
MVYSKDTKRRGRNQVAAAGMATLHNKVPYELKEALDAQATYEERSIRNVVIRAIEEYLLNHRPQDRPCPCCGHIHED